MSGAQTQVYELRYLTDQRATRMWASVHATSGDQAVREFLIENPGTSVCGVVPECERDHYGLPPL